MLLGSLSVQSSDTFCSDLRLQSLDTFCHMATYPRHYVGGSFGGAFSTVIEIYRDPKKIRQNRVYQMFSSVLLVLCLNGRYMFVVVSM